MPAKEPQTVILVSMDGMPWNLISGKFANTPNLDRVAKKGVKAEYIKTVVPGKTWPTHQSFLTGLYPESHGIVSNVFWDPVYGEVFIYEFDCSNFDPKFYNESEPIWLTLQRSTTNKGRSGVYFWPGFGGYKEMPSFYRKPICKLNCSDVDPKELPNLRNKTRNFFDNKTETFPDRVDRVMSWLKSDDPPRFVALYIDQPDWKGHSGGALSQEFKESIEQVDRDAVGYLLDQLEEESFIHKVNVIFVSDHNMVNTSSKRVILLDQYIDSSTYTLTESGSIGHIWPNEGKLDEIYNNLTRPKTPDHLTVYKKEDIPEDYHWKHNRRIPPIYVEPDVGWSVFMSNATVEPGKWVRGNHGWPPQKAETYSILFAQGPAFKVGYEIEPFSILDLYPMMCDLLGIEPRPNNGSMSIIKKMYKEEESPTAGQRSVVTWSSRALVACTAAVVALISL
ncbi:hypothetical protein OS493_028844 [Desmophyllum pertusum]|uniref:Uncharacterized protein n=1 Tax=Desmophyllum pertusum TaxID=174260 RepID=A0A9W9ZYR6_9CNID|nr:hypothetical protein OS493_028844 [Desmophyllum pertusum]